VAVNFEVISFNPTLGRCPKLEADGCVKGPIETYRGLVEYFSYPGGEHGKPFTHLQMVFGWKTWESRLPKYYHHRWAGRLCSAFAEECHRKFEAGEY
jgi:hypothetical protein